MKNFLIVVEGAHDIAFLGKILKNMNFKEMKHVNEIYPALKKLIPNSFPFTEDKLNIFNFVPFFYKKDNQQVAIVNANGEQNILNKIENILGEYTIEEIKQINKILIFADGDLKNRVEKIESILDIDFLQKEFEFLKREDLYLENPRVDICGKFDIALDYFIFPDNESPGRLEDIILEAIKFNERDLLDITNSYLDEICPSYKINWNSANSKEEKSKIGIIGNILVPGAGNTALIHSDKINWLSLSQKDKIVPLGKIYDFLEQKLV